MICSHRVRTPLPVGLDGWSPGAQPGLDHGDFRVLPGSWADPLVYMPWAGTPGDPRRQATYSAEDVAFRASQDVGSPIETLEAGYHGLRARCLRFSPWGYPHACKTRFRWVANPCRVGFGPTGSTMKGFRFCLLHFPSSLPRLRLARGTSPRRAYPPGNHRSPDRAALDPSARVAGVGVLGRE